MGKSCFWSSLFLVKRGPEAQSNKTKENYTTLAAAGTARGRARPTMSSITALAANSGIVGKLQKPTIHQHQYSF